MPFLGQEGSGRAGAASCAQGGAEGTLGPVAAALGARGGTLQPNTSRSGTVLKGAALADPRPVPRQGSHNGAS